jgi:DNA-binding transcriptional regulator GbsR (MarR family)
MSSYQDDRELFFTVKWLVVISSAIGILILIWYSFHLGMLRIWNDTETQALEHSYVVVQTKKELLIKLSQDIAKLDTQKALHSSEPEVVSALEAQKKATVDRLRSEAATLPPQERPVEIQRYLAL